MTFSTLLCVLLATVSSSLAVPTQVSDADLALITPPPSQGVAIYADHRPRQLLDSITARVDSYVNSIVSGLGTAIPSYVTDGLLPNLQGLPTGSAVLSSAGVNSSDLAASPTQVLNIPGYANWTNNAWNLRFHGNVYKQPDISNATIDDLANKFLIDVNMSQLNSTQQAQARNVTRQIFVVQQGDVSVTMDVLPGSTFGSSGESGGGGGINAPGRPQDIKLPYNTTSQGDFDVFIPLQNTGQLNGTGDVAPQRVDLYTRGTLTGNATSYLVSTQGLTVISDIDDILRVTRIYQPKDGIFNTFAQPFTPWMNMPEIYSNWSRSLPTMHFHYLTTTPEQVTRTYMQFIYNTYPGGSFDTRPLNFSDVKATLSIRKFLLDKIFQTYPNRKFILVADTSNSDVMKDYPQMATQYPNQVQCIFLRNTSATDPGDRFPYNTEGFKGLNQQMYMFFKVPDDLKGLDIANGQCYNSSIPQNVTFGYQGLPFGASTSSSNTTSTSTTRSVAGLGIGHDQLLWTKLKVVVVAATAMIIWQVL